MSRVLGGFVFGFSSVALFDTVTKNVKSFIDTPGEVTVNTKPEIVSAMGGPGIFPSSARGARTEGNLTLTVNERGNDLYESLGFATVTNIAAATSPTIGALTNVVGTSLSVVSVTATAGPTAPQLLAGEYVLEAISATTFQITGATTKGVRTSGVFTDAGTDAVETSLGLSVQRATGTVVAGDRAIFSVTPRARRRWALRLL